MSPTEPSKSLAYDAYQKLADAYAERIDSKPHNAYYERPAMLSMMPDVRGKHILDAGCGPGAYAQDFATRGATVIGMDVSDRMLERAAERLKDEIAASEVVLKQIDFSQPLEFEDQSFDLVNAPLSLDYIEDWNAVFCEFFRVLKPGGHFLFSCGHPDFSAKYFRTKKYFSIEQVESYWSGFGIKVRMPCFRRSLEETIMPVIKAGFILERVHEPLPDANFKRCDRIRYDSLMHRPSFVCIRAAKPA